MEETAEDLEDEDLQNLLAYLVTVERHPGLAEEEANQTREHFKSVLDDLTETTTQTVDPTPSASE